MIIINITSPAFGKALSTDIRCFFIQFPWSKKQLNNYLYGVECGVRVLAVVVRERERDNIHICRKPYGWSVHL